jgi:hypothetical protein
MTALSLLKQAKDFVEGGSKDDDLRWGRVYHRDRRQNDLVLIYVLKPTAA